MVTTRRIYCETLPYEDVVRPATLALLVRFSLHLVLAVRPWQLHALPHVARLLEGAGIGLTVWPMVADDEGRWASVENASSFAAFVLEIARAFEGERLSLEGMLLDLEPPFRASHAFVGSAGGAVRVVAEAAASRVQSGRARAYERGAGRLADVVRELRERGVRTSSAVWPLLVFDAPPHDVWQRRFGTPIDDLSTDHVSVMAYTTIFEGWTRGLLRRRDALALLSDLGRRTSDRWPNAGLSLGCVGTGAFGDEPVYRSPRELAEDVSIARAASCSELALFDLAGVLARAPAEAWLEAFVHGAERAPVVEAPMTRRVQIMLQLAQGLGRPWR